MACRGLLLALLAAAALGGCKLEPGGRCGVREDCPVGLDCLNHVCAACRGDGDCWSYTACSSGGLCEPRAGRCRVEADCASWQTCDAGNTCVLRADRCPTVGADCDALHRCDPAHACTFKPGACAADADCAAWMAGCDVASHSCTFSATPGDDVLAWGTLAEGREDRGAAARVTAPVKVEVGFDAGAGGAGSGLLVGGDVVYRGFVDPVAGTLVYRHVGDPGGDTLRRFNRDALAWDVTGSRWLYPAAPSANDELAIAATQCPKEWNRWIMRAGTGELLYGCPGYAAWNFFDAAGAKRLASVLAVYGWNADGYLLMRSGAGVLQIVSGAGAATAVSGLPAGPHYAYRTTATGFRVALHDAAAMADELWVIDEGTAAATIVGTYADAPGGYEALTWELVDAGGALYGRAYVSVAEVILKRPLAPGSTSVVYDEGKMTTGSNDFSAATFKPYLRLDESFLLSRP
ncbi:MAG: hypothetical protein WCC48_02305 [Anaeromyxobacteraceae bacterium]